ncbi:MAG: GNAT family N-acetyltransferase [Candidatus Odinarchaeota archaeon]
MYKITDLSSRIIEWTKTRENALKLAECYNQWDDDDSWPGGFNQGIKFTEDRILERPVTPLVAYVGVNGKQFVGYIDVYQHGIDTDALFVGLLGVSPEFQGKGYGRDLLKKVNEFAAKKEGINHIELGTWAGNTKSVPTYKRTGYKWTPLTTVLMVNYLPAILKFPPFEDFFSTNDYYKTLVREVKQEPDKERFENMDVFIYRFDNGEGERIEALIDRYAKRLTGFSVKKREGEIGLWCLLDSHEGYVGYGSTKVTWRVKNTTSRELKIKITARGSGGLDIDKGIDLVIVAPPGKTVEYESTVILDFSTVLKSLQDFSPRYESTIITDVELEKQNFSLITAQKPVKTFKLSSFPEIPVLSEWNELQHALQITNMTRDRLKTRITIPAREGVKAELMSSELQEIGSKSSVNLKINIQCSKKLEPGIIKIPIQLEVLEKHDHQNTFLEHFFVLLSREYTATGHCNVENPVSEPFFLQNPLMRVNFKDNQPFEIDRIDNLVTGHYMDAFGPNIDLGPPYEGFFNEWQRQDKKYQLEIEKKLSTATLTYRSHSSRFPIVLERHVITHAGLPGYLVRYRLTNTAEKTIKMDLKTGFGTNNAHSDLICPFKDGITVFNTGDANYPRNIKEPGRYFHENWFCRDYSHGMISGVIWEGSTENLSVLQLQGGYTEFRWEKISINPGKTAELGFKVIVTAGNWEVIRGYWLKERGINGAGPFHGGLLPRDSIDIQVFLNAFHSAIASSSVENLNVRITNQGENPVDGTLHLKLQGSGLAEVVETSVPVEKLTTDNPFEKTIPVQVKRDLKKYAILSGSASLETRYIDLVKQFSLLLYPERMINITGPEILGGETQYSINNGYLNYNADTTAAINFLTRVEKHDNLLESRFPDRNASFVFFNPFIGGIQPLIRFFGSRETEILVNEQAHFQIEKFVPEESAPWQGVRANYLTAGSHPGIAVTVEHLTLPGVNFIKSRISLENQRDEFLLLRFGFFVFLTTEGGKAPKAEIMDYQGQVIQKLPSQYAKPSRDDQWFQMTTVDPGIKLGFIPDGPASSRIDYYTAGDKIRCVRIYMGHKIEPNERAVITLYTILLDENEKVTDYLFLREWDASKYPEKGSECLEMIDFPLYYG